MASTIKVDTVQNQPGTNIINKCGTTITIGASSDTVALATGASQSGFGQTYSAVSWVTDSIKTATFTAVAGKGYFCNTTGGAFEVDLPAGTAGDTIAVNDYANTFDTAALTVDPNGSEKINGNAGQRILETEGLTLTFVYVDSTRGWQTVQDSTDTTAGSDYMVATGGTITTCGNYKIHKFTGPGTFTVTTPAAAAPDNVVDYVVVAGGGGYGENGGAGGAGGMRFASTTYTQPSPLKAPAALPVSVQAYPITVGGGGAQGSTSPSPPDQGDNGTNSVFSTITSAGGGGGGSRAGTQTGKAGGSGGGGGDYAPTNCGGAGNTPPTSPPQGNPGGNGSAGEPGGGGGGIVAAGCGSDFGTGLQDSITGTSTWYAIGGTGDGGTARPTATYGPGVNQGFGAGPTSTGGTGQPGIVVIRYRYQ